jgi:hypothetical protein
MHITLYIQMATLTFQIAIFYRAKSASSELILVELMKSFCLPLILYATEAVGSSKTDTKMMDKMVNNSLGKIFGTYDASIIDGLRCLPHCTDIVKGRT